MPQSAFSVRLTGFQLKLLAAAAMLADHIAAVVLIPVFGTSALTFALRAVGRIAFPLYCFLLAEGFRHTRNRRNYALRLGFFALLSEIPFDLAFNGCLIEPEDNNVFFTLLLGFLLLCAMDKLRCSPLRSPLLLSIGFAAVTAAACGLSLLLRADYGFAGVLCVLVIWLLSGYPALGLLCCAAVLVHFYGSNSFFVLLAIPPVLLYSGERGRSGKHGFYLFYPLHLLALRAVAYLLTT
ncbi:MAG: hypothetical protein IJA51_02315 [Oscillospiraceae bacterium]|nr:hypothetical protein [Oscillospiraceae bacterium]